MQHYRETIIKQIIQSPDAFSIESLIYKSIQQLIENGTHPFIVLRFIDKLKTSLNEMKEGVNSDQQVGSNVIEALNVLRDYDEKKLTEARSKGN